MHNIIPGQKFGRLTFIEDCGINSNGKRISKCVCDCGKVAIVRRDSLLSGNTQSCGCLRLEALRECLITHGETRTRLYSIYSDMKTRCHYKTHKSYCNYGGRGITICDEWLGEHGAENFLKWAKENGYADNLTLDRIDNAKGYSPDNCRWVSNRVQSNNKRTNRFYTYNGETKTIAQWADLWGVEYWWARHWLLKIGIDEVVKVVNGEKMVARRTKRRTGKDRDNNRFERASQ